MEKYYTDERTGIHYTLNGDYYLPNLVMPDETKYEIGRFGRAHEAYLKEHKRSEYTQLLLSGRLNAHLHEIDSAARQRQDVLVKQYALAQGVNEQLKADNQMEWVGKINNIAASVREVVFDEMIYR